MPEPAAELVQARIGRSRQDVTKPEESSALVDFNGRVALVIRGEKAATYKIEVTSEPAAF